MPDKTTDRMKVNGTTYMIRDADAQENLGSKTVNFKRYLTSSDNAVQMPVGVYGISSTSGSHPSNLPDDYPATASGTLVALERGFNASYSTMYFVFAAYAKRVWFYTGYVWKEISSTDYVMTQLSSVYADLAPILQHLAQDSYAAGNAVTATKTQFKFLGENGPADVGETYTDWYITNAISVTPLTFYCVTASAQYSNHDLYQLLDSDGNIVHRETIPSTDAVSITEKLILIPEGVAKIQIASITGADGAALYETVEKSATEKWAGKKWVCIGDSLTDTNIRTTMHYHDYIAQKTGITVVNLGKGGTGYKKSYDGNGPFIDRVDQIPLDADVVTIFGSGNDGSYTIGDPSDTGTDSLCSAINATIAAIFDRITTCQLGIVTPTPWQGYNPADDTNWMAQYSAAIVEICKRWGIPCLDLYHCSNLRPWDADFRAAAYSKDDGGGTHPDETGHALIAPRFEAFLDSLLLA